MLGHAQRKYSLAQILLVGRAMIIRDMDKNCIKAIKNNLKVTCLRANGTFSRVQHVCERNIIGKGRDLF
jgi:hypothetical protein